MAVGVWIAAFAVMFAWIGLPTDAAYVFVWLWAATIAWNPHLPFRSHLRFVRDWVPLAVLLEVYNVSRGFADDGVRPHVTEMVDADRSMWGWLTGGRLPTEWLQDHLYDPARIHWYDVLVSFVYFSHFVTALTVAAVLWVRNRARWAAFTRRWFTLTALGLATYFLYPAAPPWWAGEHGVIDPVVRISTRGWKEIGLHGAGGILGAAQIHVANPVAAMPSLHTAFAVLVVAFFLPSVRARWWPVLVAYPLAMTFTLVYSGEHYVVDVLVGAGYALVTVLGLGVAERWWAARRAGPKRDQAGDRAGEDQPELAADRAERPG